MKRSTAPQAGGTGGAAADLAVKPEVSAPVSAAATTGAAASTTPATTTTPEPASASGAVAPSPVPASGLGIDREAALRQALLAKLKPQLVQAAQQASLQQVAEEVKRKRADDPTTRAAKRAAKFAGDLAELAKDNEKKDAEKRKHLAPFVAARDRGVFPTGGRFSAHAHDHPYPELIRLAGGLEKFVADVVTAADFDAVSFGKGRADGETTFSIDLKVAAPHHGYGRQNQTIAGSFDGTGAVKVFHVGPFG
ncbi:hypothetical protein AB0D66_33075 [Streptomyces sp. NPDC048270]|uniref:hypothetical protein n=1 Tax=Streptomyces sp. NPDC048270 TaxID=3154615 RepID=UPI0034002C5C